MFFTVKLPLLKQSQACSKLFTNIISSEERTGRSGLQHRSSTSESSIKVNASSNIGKYWDLQYFPRYGYYTHCHTNTLQQTHSGSAYTGGMHKLRALALLHTPIYITHATPKSQTSRYRWCTNRREWEEARKEGSFIVIAGKRKREDESDDWWGRKRHQQLRISVFGHVRFSYGGLERERRRWGIGETFR